MFASAGKKLSSISMKVFSGGQAEPEPAPEPPTMWESVVNQVDAFFEMSYMQRMAGFIMTVNECLARDSHLHKEHTSHSIIGVIAIDRPHACNINDLTKRCLRSVLENNNREEILIAGLVMMGLASMYLPMVLIGMPQKFAFTYAVSNLLLLTSSCFMVGPKKQIENMMQSHRAFAAVGWLTSTLGLLYVVWRMRFFVYVATALSVQVVCLLYYVGTYLPWGNTWVTYIIKTWASMTMKICKGICCFCFNRGGSGSSSGSSLLPM
eukprot:jgi/Bigna1/87019/estExt_fgenesh1_pg.C_160038